MNVYYESSNKEKLALADWPLMIQNPEALFSSSWQYDAAEVSGNGGKIVKFKRGMVTKSLKISALAESKIDYEHLIAHVNEVFEKDLISLQPGKLFVNDYYLTGYMISRDYGDYEDLFDSVEMTMEFLAEYPFWVKEEKHSFLVQNGDLQDDFLDYPHDYPYDYGHERTIAFLENAHYAPVDFRMTIYGPVDNPSIRIADHLYKVNIPIYENEYLVIDTRSQTIEKTTWQGEKVNAFHNRHKQESVFTPIPPGKNILNWSMTFGIDVLLYLERSEPIWNL